MSKDKQIGLFRLNPKHDAIGIAMGSSPEFTLTLVDDCFESVEQAEQSICLRSDVGPFVVLPFFRHPR